MHTHKEWSICQHQKCFLQGKWLKQKLKKDKTRFNERFIAGDSFDGSHYFQRGRLSSTPRDWTSPCSSIKHWSSTRIQHFPYQAHTRHEIQLCRQSKVRRTKLKAKWNHSMYFLFLFKNVWLNGLQTRTFAGKVIVRVPSRKRLGEFDDELQVP